MRQSEEYPTLMEAALGTFLHDAGKFLQRAHGATSKLPPEVRSLEGTLLPVHKGGWYSHKHALWTEEFFQTLERKGLKFPGGIRMKQVRDVAVYHHNPDSPAAMLCTAADRLSSGMERKEKDEEREVQAESKGWDAFIRTPLRSPFERVDLGRGKAPARVMALGEFVPGEALMPRQERSADTAGYQEVYRKLWERLRQELEGVFAIRNVEVFTEALLSLSERYFSTVPSSTVDEPDISLHDHSRTAAAIAAALHAWHEEDGSLEDRSAIEKNGEAKKFRLLVGDLSGIQSSLFTLANQQVKGASRILRARSFTFSMLVEAAVLAARREFGLPVFNVLQSAGGRFLLLVPALRDAEARVERVREEIDRWMFRRYRGELALNLALSAPFAGETMGRKTLPRLMREQVSGALEDAKLRSFRGVLKAVIEEDVYENGPCSACGRRPGVVEVKEEAEAQETWRCEVCEEERRVGGMLPHAAYFGWRRSPSGAETMGFFSGLWLEWHDREPVPGAEHVSMARVYRGRETAGGALALRYLATHVPRVTEEEEERGTYAGLPEENRPRAGEVKTFECLAIDARRPAADGGYKGEDHLAVLKADVDRLGAIFGEGLKDPTIARHAAVSRMMDLFFTGYLYRLLEERYPSTYTVYAGGDDLLLIGPWKQTLHLANELRAKFGLWTGENSNITLSAGVELMKVNHPINRTVVEAEERLERAKESGRDRVCAIDRRAVTWEAFREQLEKAEMLSRLMEEDKLSHQVVYKVLQFDEMRRKAEGQRGRALEKEEVLDLGAATWRAKWGYHLARNVMDNRKLAPPEKAEAIRLLNSLLGLDEQLKKKEQDWEPAPRIAVSVALYQNR